MKKEEWAQILEDNRNCLKGDCDGMRTESTAKTIGKVGEIIQNNPDPTIAQSCVVPILSEIALSLAAIADKDEKTTEILERIDDRISEWMQSI